MVLLFKGIDLAVIGGGKGTARQQIIVAGLIVLGITETGKIVLHIGIADTEDMGDAVKLKGVEV